MKTKYFYRKSAYFCNHSPSTVIYGRDPKVSTHLDKILNNFAGMPEHDAEVVNGYEESASFNVSVDSSFDAVSDSSFILV